MLDWLRHIVALGGAFAGATTAAGQEEALAVPSGFPVYLQEWLLEDKPDGAHDYARFRFVMPAIGQGAGIDMVAADMSHLCDTLALRTLGAHGVVPDRIVVSLAADAREFGEIDASVIQFFEIFSASDDSCILEEF